MTHNKDAQQWVLLGTAPASAEIWGVREINFPCGYMMPPGAFVAHGQTLERPSNSDVWVMGGFAVELSTSGKMISVDEVDQYVAGYRPWTCVFHNTLLDELNGRGHTIEMWDRGVSIFYGLWNQGSQWLGDLIPSSEFASFMNSDTNLEVDGALIKGAPASLYAHNASDIVNFMSQFMTLSRGDQWVQGPLVAGQLPKHADCFTYRVGELKIEMMVA